MLVLVTSRELRRLTRKAVRRLSPHRQGGMANYRSQSPAEVLIVADGHQHARHACQGLGHTNNIVVPEKENLPFP